MLQICDKGEERQSSHLTASTNKHKCAEKILITLWKMLYK